MKAVLENGGMAMSDSSLWLTVRQLRRRLTFWRVLAVLAVVTALALALWRAAPSVAGAHVARIRIDGFITGQQKMLDLIDQLARNQRVKALIVRIDSPGGTTAGSEALYRALKRLAQKKPVVTVMDGIATSGGYMVALAGERIFASPNTITGSIGVIVQWPELHELLGRVGVRVQSVRSGPLKALPNTFEPTPESARQALEALVRDSHEWFVDMVAKRRKLDAATVRRLADGRVYSGRRALQEKLIDALGDERAARRWLEKAHGIAFDTKVVEYRPRESLLKELGVPGALAAILRLFGLDVATPALLTRRSGLDGLLSVWHPELAAPGKD